MPLCGSCGKDNASDARFCSACGTPLAAQTAEPSRDLRKTVTVVFCDLVGSTGLGELLDSESLRGVMSRYYAAMRAALERHGGRVEKFIGDAVMAVFGVPTLHEDDALRAVRAAADMRAALPSLNEDLERRWGARLQTRIGVSTGEVVAGDPARGESFVVGDAVNVAARLEQEAPPGGILLGASTRRLVRDAVEAEAVGAIALRGKGEPVAAFRLIEVLDPSAWRARRLGSPIVGREEELMALDAAFERCCVDRSCRIVTVIGQAGVGKSRLAHEFISALGDRAGVVRGRCLPYGEGITFWPLAEIVRDVTGIADGDSPEEARGRIVGLLSGEERRAEIAAGVAGAIGLSEAVAPPEETSWAIRRFLEALARDRPMVVLLDDVHWGEPTFLDLVEYIVGASRGAALLVVCLARPELCEVRPALWGARATSTALRVDALDDDESRLLVANLLDGATLADDVSDRIMGAAEGNPLFVEELVRVLVDDGLVERREGRWRAVESLAALSVPPTIEALLGARLDRLDDEERAIIERAAVIGHEFSSAAVAELSREAPRAAIDTHLQALVRRELVRPAARGSAGEDSFRFSHILIRDVAYGRLLKETRSDLHERLAAWLERSAGERVGEYEEILGYHLEQACGYRQALGPLDERGRALGHRAARHLARAGRRALARGDMPAAANLLERASILQVEDPLTRLETMLDLATALSEAGTLARADLVVDDVIAAAAALGDRRLAEHSLLARAWFRTFRDPSLRSDELVDVAQRATAVFDELGDEAGLAKAWHLIGQAEFLACRCRSSADASERALRHARRAGDRGRETEVLMSIVIAHYFGPTSSANAIRVCREMLAREAGHHRVEASALNALAGLSAMRGRFREARALYSRGRAIGAEFGSKVTMAAMALYSGEVEMLAGDHAAAERDLRWAHAILVEIGETALLSTVAAQLAEAICAQGRASVAERFTRESEAASAEGDVFAQVAWRSARAKALARLGDVERAEELVRHAVRLAADSDALNLRAEAAIALAEVLTAAGRRDQASPALHAAVRLFDEKGNVVAARKAQAMLVGASTAHPVGGSR